MARTHGRIYTAIWSNGDFRRLTEREQRLYMLLLSQPQITNCGVLPYVPKKWQKLAVDSDEASIRDALGGLWDRRFIVLDEETDELLIRTFVRHDRIEKQPQLLAAARREFSEIESRQIRRTLIAEYPDLFGDLETDDLREPLPEPLFQVSLDPSPDPSAEDFADSSNDPSLARATHAHTRAPSPSPTPAPSPVEIEEMAVRPSREETPNGRLPIDKEREVEKLLAEIGTDADEQTPNVVRWLAKRVAVGAIAKVRESLHSAKADNRAAYAVGALQSEFAELAQRR